MPPGDSLMNGKIKARIPATIKIVPRLSCGTFDESFGKVTPPGLTMKLVPNTAPRS
jgi:hypothetical protein